ncbi:MAG: hypothetical protein WC285_03235 [Candidatus Gracilibacteria bacterium]|jgi:hypothetical protein
MDRLGGRLTPEEEGCLVDGLNVASAIISDLTGQQVFLTVPALRVTANDNSPGLVAQNEQRIREWKEAMERAQAERDQAEREREAEGGLSGGATLAMLFTAVTIAQAGATGKQVLDVLKSAGVVKPKTGK